VAPILLIDQSVCLPFFTIEHEHVLRKDLNNSEIRYTKNYVFSWRGVYTPYSPCMSTPLLNTPMSKHWSNFK